MLPSDCHDTITKYFTFQVTIEENIHSFFKIFKFTFLSKSISFMVTTTTTRHKIVQIQMMFHDWNNIQKASAKYACSKKILF